ncbi:brain protein I3 [Corythoichthys intestinalis]|uniref:brain protein I3 n=1 Tax=Corythoichthys intestinalis TaxID=161448 RepID=UPI0025A5BBD1|nr:brain protein I3 [Corythoichthys intestinalis]XP_057716756.1 brain protein I3 [Corythoichthys intestinalis]XP_057716757.1 brain protein I3 [Corythoichthys intestinalis]XP_057716758.1 brain protein I3 [Corythoichthys intestinalis]XP_061805559.1 membrane protein BRI3-like [Nerophis lumbriciformis]
MVDSKPILQDRPPAYNTVPGAYEYAPPQQQAQQPHSYGAIPAAAPPPYHYPDSRHAYPTAQMGAAVSHQPYSGTYTVIQPSVVVVGGCPACRVGVLEDDFTCLGILCAIFFFPLGILFCFVLRQRRCPNCGATFG